MAHAHEAFWEDVQQVATQQFLAGQSHDLASIAVTVVFIAQVQRLAIEIAEAAVGQGDTMAVTAKIVHHRLGSRQAGFGIDHPVGRHERFEHAVDLGAPAQTGECAGLIGMS